MIKTIFYFIFYPFQYPRLMNLRFTIEFEVMLKVVLIFLQK